VNSKEGRTGSNFAESSKKVYGSKGAIFASDDCDNYNSYVSELWKEKEEMTL
jgi:hypothetical protein